MCLQVRVLELVVQGIFIAKLWLGKNLLKQKGGKLLECHRQILAIEGMTGKMGVPHTVIDHAAFANDWNG